MTNAIPMTLISAVEDQANPNADLVGKTLCELARALSNELLAGTKTSDHRDSKTVLKYVMASLNKSVDRLGIHGRRETIESFALLAQRDNATLGQIPIRPDLHHSHSIHPIIGQRATLSPT